MRGWYVCLLVCLLLGRGQPVEAQQLLEETTVEEETLLDGLGLSQVQDLVDRTLAEESFSIRDAVEGVMSGELPVTAEGCREIAERLLLSGFSGERTRFINLFLLLLFAAVYTSLCAASGSSVTAQTGFYVVYLLEFTMLANAFSQLSEALGDKLLVITQIMQGLAPAYYLAVAASSGTSTAVVFYQGILILVWGIEWLLKTFLLPAVNLYLLLGLTNQLSEEALLGRMAGLLNTVITWSLRTILGTMVGLQVIQSLIAPVIDGLKRSAVGKTAQALPGIGNAIGSVTQLLLGSAVLIRNSLGIVFLIILVLVGLEPLLHYAFLSLSYRFLAALSQPICDKRLVGCLGTMGESCALLLRLCLTAEVMCVLAFVVLMVPAQGG